MAFKIKKQAELKVLFLGGFPYPEQPQKNIFNFRAVSDLRKEVDIEVVTIRMWRPGRQFINRTTYKGISVIYLCVPHYNFKNSFLYFINLKIVELFGRILLKKDLKNADLIHSAGGDFYGMIGGWWAKTYRIKHLCQLIGSDINSTLPRLIGFPSFKKLPDRINFLSANSKALLQQFQSVYPTSDLLGKSIYRGVDLKVFYPANKSDLDKKIHFYYLGGFSAYPGLPHGLNTKGGLTLMDAWKINESFFKEKNVRLSIAGPDSNNNSILEEWFNSLNYPELVTIIGLIPPEQLTEHYAKADVVIVPSMEEGLPNVSVEAAASACVVLGTKVGGIPEVIEHEHSGLLFEAGDEEALGKAMIRLVRDPAQIKTLRLNARQRMEEHFDANNFSIEYLKLYKQCVE